MVHGENVERHLAKMHAEAEPAQQAAVVVLAGVDRGARRTFGGLLGIVLILAAVALGLGGQPSDGVVALAVLVLLSCFGLFGLSLLGVFKAELRLEAGAVRLRFLFGLRERVMALPAELEVGRLVEMRVAAGSHQLENAPGEEVRAGAYLKLTQGGRSLVVGARGAGLAQRWAAGTFRQAKKRASWDITLERQGMLQLEYHLARLGLLRPRLR